MAKTLEMIRRAQYRRNMLESSSRARCYLQTIIASRSINQSFLVQMAYEATVRAGHYARLYGRREP